MWSRDGHWLLDLVGPIATTGRAGGYYGDYGWENVLDWHR